MEDFQIVDLFWARDESAIAASQIKYGRMLQSTAFSILQSDPDAEEVVNDVYLAAWGQIPPQRPVYLGAFLTKIARNLALKKYRSEHAQKRTANRLFEELNEVTIAQADEYMLSSEEGQEQLAGRIERFLAGQTPEKRAVFLRRYFYAQEIGQIAVELHMSSSKVKMILLRMRRALQSYLKEDT